MKNIFLWLISNAISMVVTILSAIFAITLMIIVLLIVYGPIILLVFIIFKMIG